MLLGLCTVARALPNCYKLILPSATQKPISVLVFWYQTKRRVMEKMIAPPLGQSWNADLGWHDDDAKKIIYLDDNGRIVIHS